MDTIVEYLRNNDIELTRENYLAFAYPDGVPDDLDEKSLPESVRVVDEVIH